HPISDGFAEKWIEPVLDSHDGNDRLGLANLSHRNVRQANPADLPFPGKLCQCTDAFCEWHIGIGSVQLIEIDALDSQRAKRPFTGLAQRCRPSVPFPTAAGTSESAFGAVDDRLAPPGPGGERTSHQALIMTQVTLVEAIDVGSIDEGDPGVERGMDHPDPLLFGGSILEGEVHPAESDGGDGGSPRPERPVMQGPAVWSDGSNLPPTRSRRP